jgi:hypothetical protein
VISLLLLQLLVSLLLQLMVSLLLQLMVSLLLQLLVSLLLQLLQVLQLLCSLTHGRLNLKNEQCTFCEKNYKIRRLE